ncbi:MAG TPA: metallophosphoesterase [Propioniciclava tarda]|nr:metallophosphoesterase [Propioniciclava tarda]
MHRIAHLSDCHLRPVSGLVGGVVDADARLRRAIEVLTTWDKPCDAWFFGGDLTDEGDADTYVRLRELVEPAASACGVQVIWGNGNHDGSDAFARVLWGVGPGDGLHSDSGLRQAQPAVGGSSPEGGVGPSTLGPSYGQPDPRSLSLSKASPNPPGLTKGQPDPRSLSLSKVQPLNRTYDLRGLRFIALDSVVAGRPEGRLSEVSLAWLSEVLATPAVHGSILALHHPPVPPVQDAAGLWPLTNPDALAEVVRGSDVRLIIGGHFHQTSFTTLAGVPVAAASSLTYTQDLTAGRTLRGQDAHAGFNLIEVHEEQVVVTAVQLDVGVGVHRALSPADVDRMRR